MARPAASIGPYGSWASPIASELVARAGVTLGQIQMRGDAIFFTEGRPKERGRNVLLRSRGQQCEDVTSPEHNVRTRVHEYGGGDYVAGDGSVFFSNFSDQRVYRQDHGTRARPLTRSGELRFADFQLDDRAGRLICVREDKRLVSSREDVNTIVAIDLDANGEQEGTVLVEGHDFYASPRISGDGRTLAWLCWNRPDMPWDAAELWIGSIGEGGSVHGARRIAGGKGESVFQPEWAGDGSLTFVSDRSGFWNLYRFSEGETACLFARSADFGLPQWVFGLSTYASFGDGKLITTFHQHGSWHLALLDITRGALSEIATGYTWFSGLRASATRAVFLAGSATKPTAIVELDFATLQFREIRSSSSLSFGEAYLSRPEPISFATENGKTAHAYYYAPKNPEFVAPPGELPPLLVRAHGGPTGATSTQFSPAIQFWTSRGVAVVDVNYGGSSGYGRAYRDRLKGQWGVVDVDDCANAARFLVERGDADSDRIAITGASAGGYTALAALTFRKTFRAGASHYGISDLQKLADDALTGNHHKFESRYHEGLIGPYPEALETYRARSPIQHTNRLSCPVIFFQGLEDRVVLPNQATRMVEAMRTRGLPVAYVPFAGEGHGFRRAENIQRALDAELYFYSRMFGFTTTSDRIDPVLIENMSEPQNAVRICFVCLGNICRSPSAESVLRHQISKAGLDTRVHVESAGMGDWHVGNEADQRARETGQRRGYTLDRRAQQFTPDFFERFDLVIALDRSNRAALRDLATDDASRRKIHLLRDFDPGSPPGSDVPDPYYGGPEGFEEVLDLCEAACTGLVARLLKGSLP